MRKGKDKQILTQKNLNAINNLIKQAEPYYKEYCKALKEIWASGKIDREKDFNVLKEHRLGTGDQIFTQTNRYGYSNLRWRFYWNYEINQLNRLFKNNLKGEIKK